MEPKTITYSTPLQCGTSTFEKQWSKAMEADNAAYFPKTPTLEPTNVLLECANLLSEREKTHGYWKNSMAFFGRMALEIFRTHDETCNGEESEEVFALKERLIGCRLMVALKMARDLNNGPQPDTYPDFMNYAAMAEVTRQELEMTLAMEADK